MQHFRFVPFIILLLTFSCEDGNVCEKSECLLVIEDRVYRTGDDFLEEINTYEYNDNGELLELYKTFGNGDFLLSNSYKYDESDNLIEWRHRYRISNGNYTHYYVIENGLRVREDYHNYTGNYSNSLYYYYNSDNRLIATERCNMNSDACEVYEQYTEFIYDNHLLVEENTYNVQGGNLRIKVTYVYNSDDLMIQETHQNFLAQPPTITSDIYYTYNEQNQLIYFVYKDMNGEIDYEETHTYDECGRIVFTIRNRPGNEPKEQFNTYDCM